LPHQERLNIAVFIDFDNIEIGVKSTLNEHFDVGIILDAIKERGEVVTKIAYADWTRASEYSRHLTQHAIRLVQRNLTPGGDKNGADINLALDALEMVFTHQHINAYVIVGGDSDFLSLVEKLKQYDKKVFVVGGRAFTSVILQRNCHEFIAYENLTRSRKPVAKGERPTAATAVAPIGQAIPIVRRALKILSDREVSPQTGLLKSTLLQLDSTFSERNYGASSFLDFVEKLAQAGLVQLKHAGRSVMVELNEGFSGEPDAVEAPAEAAQAVRSAAEPPVPVDPAVPQAGTNADGVRLAGQILRSATTARWPMYLRNVKQILRAHRGDPTLSPNGDGGFDERRYGFGGLMDLLRACQREGLVRVERDRRGGLRVFPGQGLQRTDTPPTEPVLQSSELQGIEIEPGEPLEMQEPMEKEPAEAEPIPIDTTAELLGRAKHRRPASLREPQGRSEPGRVATGSGRGRGRSGGVVPETPHGARKAAARKPATRRTSRSKKVLHGDTPEDVER